MSTTHPTLKRWLPLKSQPCKEFKSKAVFTTTDQQAQMCRVQAKCKSNNPIIKTCWLTLSKECKRGVKTTL